MNAQLTEMMLMASLDGFVDVCTGAPYSAVYFRNIRYRSAEGEVFPVLQTAAWCFDCDNVVAAEHLPSSDEISAHREAMARLLAAREGSVKIPVDRVAQYRSFMSCRTSGPRCLTCYGERIVKLATKTDAITEIPGGPTLRHAAFEIADCGVEPACELNIDGERFS